MKTYRITQYEAAEHAIPLFTIEGSNIDALRVEAEKPHKIERRKDVRARIAEAVAKRWLEEAEAILAGGLTPVKLSKQHRMLVQEHADSIGVDLNTWEVRDIARSAVKEARYWILNSDRFPNVKQWVSRGLSQSLEDGRILFETK